jgi:hypothetical protein
MRFQDIALAVVSPGGYDVLIAEDRKQGVERRRALAAQGAFV